MLILTRRPGEAIRIGDEVEIYVVAVNGNQIPRGIKAPKSVPVHREEMYARINAQTAAHLDARPRRAGSGSSEPEG